jgi:hypothetical protein
MPAILRPAIAEGMQALYIVLIKYGDNSVALRRQPGLRPGGQREDEE